MNQQVKSYHLNTTQIPNAILDYWMGILSNAELKCLLAISRKTFGWQKQKDKITKRQIGQASGLSNDAVRKAIRELEKRGLILCKTNPNRWGKHDPNTYEVNEKILNQTRENSRKEGSEITPLGSDFDAQRGLNSSPRWGVKSSPTKQSLTKQTIQKGNAPSPQTENVNNTKTHGALNEALPFSMPKKKALKEKSQKQSSRKKPLNYDQAAIVAWLENQNIQGASYDTLTYWTCNYSIKKISSAVDALRYEIEKGTIFKKSQAAFVRSCLDRHIIPVDDSLKTNKIFAIKFSKENNWSSLKIYEKYVKDKFFDYDLNLYMEKNEFESALKKLFERHKNNEQT